MSIPSNVVSIHPYFKIHPGNMEAARALMLAFVEKTKTEPKNLYYDFTVNEDVVFCREGYLGSEGALAHLGNVEALLGEMLKLASLERLEVHGPAAELEKMKGPLAGWNPVWFELECGRAGE
jgi:quinol monooxygenase YgiN